MIVGAYLMREMFDHFAIADEEKIVVDRDNRPNLGKERPHVLLAVALAGRMVFGRRTSRRAVPAWNLGVDPLTDSDALLAPPQDRRRGGRNPHACGPWRRHVASPTQHRAIQPRLEARSRASEP